MSGTVDTRTVEMRFDNKNFESNVKQSMSTLDKLKQKLKLDGATKGLKEVENSSKKLDFKDADKSVGKLGKSFSALETIATGVFLRIGMKAADAGARMVKSLSINQVVSGWNKYAEKTTAVQTIMSNLKDDASKFTDEVSKMNYVNRYLEKLMWFSDETSYNFTDMTGNVGKFIANGQDLEESVTAMQGIASWAAISGQNAQTASRAMYNIAQAMGTGSMKIKDWMSIENANMATAQFKELAITVGQKQGKIKEGQVTIESFRESLSGKDTNGWFDKKVMMEVFETYGEAADRIQSYAKSHNITSTEAIREIKKQDAAFADSIGFKAFAAAQEAKTFGEVITATADAASTKWLQFFENIFGNYEQAKKLWTDLSEDLYDIFVEPLNGLNDIMSVWNRGFFKNGPKNILENAFETGKLDSLESGFRYISEKSAEQAVALDSSTYSIQLLEDGTKRLVRTIKNSDGTIQKYYKTIFNPGEDLISGRDMLIGGFKNIMEAFFTGYEIKDEKGNVIKEVLSVLQTIKAAFGDIFFPKDNEFSIAKKLWELSKRFKEFTERLKPSQETLDKIKNSFKGLFTIFKMAGKFVSAIFKPIKNIFKQLFGGKISDGVLNLTDSFSNWIQKLDDFFEKNETFKKISNGIENGLNTISKALTGLSISELIEKIRTSVTNFFNDFNFEETFSKIANWLKKINFTGIISTIGNVFRAIFNFVKNIFLQINQVETGGITDKLTPIQDFWIGLKNIFNGIKSIIPVILRVFGKIGSAIGTAISSMSKSDELPEKLTPLENFWIGIKSLFEGVKSVLSMLSGPFRKIATVIGQFLTNISGKAEQNGKVNRAVKRSVEESNDVLKGVKDLIKGIIDLAKSLWGVFSVVASITGKVFSKIAEKIQVFLENPNMDSILRTLLRVGTLILLIAVLRNTAKEVKWVKKTVNTVVGFVDALRNPLKDFSNAMKDIAKSTAGQKAKAHTLMAVAAIIIAVGASIALIAKATKEIGFGKVLAIAGILAVFSLIPFLLTFFADKILNKKIEPTKTKTALSAISSLLLSLSGSLLILSAAFKLMSKIDTSKLGVISAIFAAFIFVASVVGFGVLKITEKMPNKKIASTLRSVSGSMVAIAAALIALSIAFKIFASIKFDNTSIGIISLIFTGFIAITSLIAVGTVALLKKIPDKNIVSRLAMISGLMIAIAVALIALSIAFKKFASIKFDNASIGTISLIFTGFTLIATGMAALATVLIKNAQSIASIAVMAGFMVTAAFSLIIVAHSFAQIPKDISPSQMAAALAIIVTFSAIVAVLSVIGAVLANTGIGAAGMALVALIITAIGFACIAAGAGISLFVSSISNLIDAFSALMEAVTNNGPAFVEQIDKMINAGLNSLINSSDKIKNAAVKVITAIAEGFLEAGPIVSYVLVAVLIMVMKNVSDTMNASADMLAYTLVTFIVKIMQAIPNNIRLYAPVMVDAMRQTMEAIIEVAILGLASLVETFGPVGKLIAKQMTEKWIPAVRNAMETVDPENDSVLQKVFEDNIRLAESGEMAGNAITDLSRDVKNLFGLGDLFKDGFDLGFDFEDGEGFFDKFFGDAGNFFGIGDRTLDEMKKVSSAVKKETPEVQKALAKAFSTGELDKITSGYSYISSKAAEAAANAQPDRYIIESMEDGTQRLRAVGTKFYKEIYDVPSDVVDEQSGVADTLLSPFEEVADQMGTSGSDAIVNFMSGMEGKFTDLQGVCEKGAGIIRSIFGFSEPEIGPLSNFHTYAPDMIKLWCSGVKSNLGMIDSSTDSLTGRVEDGFATALDYVSGLINGGMSDDLTIRPILDLSEIQNGTRLLDSMLSNGSTYPLYGTSSLASSAAYNMQSSNSKPSTAAPIVSNAGDIHNTFNISSNDPNAVAQAVSKIINQQVRRKQAVWAK